MPHRSDRRLYLDADDNVVEADDPNRVKLLVGKGGEIPMEDARRYGLVGDAPEAPTASEKPAAKSEAGKAVRGQERDPDDERPGKKS